MRFFRPSSYLLSYIFILILAIGLVHAVEYDEMSSVDSLVAISNSFNILSYSNSYNIEYVNATFLSFPKPDERQIVKSISTVPDISLQDNPDSISFFFKNPGQTNFNTEVSSEVITKNYLTEVKIPVIFPLQKISPDLYQYMQPSQIIDINPQIRDLSSQLIGSKTDLYSIEYSFAEYVRMNINYDLESLTSSASQKSSWVLQNKKGVCDELSSLFISLNRASGIPARFVSGVAYTDLNDTFGTNWVPHAWAEVYFPGYGWVPFDVTYGEYGFLDAGHIKLQDSVDASGSSINYNYLGKNIQLNPGQLNIDVNVNDYGIAEKASYIFSTSVLGQQVGFNSYDLVEVDLRNPNTYYVVADMYLANTENVDIIDDSPEIVLNKTIHRKEVLLKPYESRTVYWLIHLNGNFDKNYIYTLPISVYDFYNESNTVNLDARSAYRNIDKQYFQSIIDSQVQEDIKPYSGFITLECTPDKNMMYIEDEVNVNCVLDNVGDQTFSNVSLCMDDNCTTRSLNIDTVSFSFSKKFDSTGPKNIQVKASSSTFLKASYVQVDVMDKPSISIESLNYPLTTNYDDKFDITFTLKPKSESIPENLTVSVMSPVNSVEWRFDSLQGQRAFTLSSIGSAMKPGDNTYKILLNYKDDKGNAYSEEQSFMIHNNSGFFQSMLLYFNVIGHSIEMVFTG